MVHVKYKPFLDPNNDATDKVAALAPGLRMVYVSHGRLLFVGVILVCYSGHPATIT
jgi:hypothetical protein